MTPGQAAIRQAIDHLIEVRDELLGELDELERDQDGRTDAWNTAARARYQQARAGWATSSLELTRIIEALQRDLAVLGQYCPDRPESQAGHLPRDGRDGRTPPAGDGPPTGARPPASSPAQTPQERRQGLRDRRPWEPPPLPETPDAG